ncbi:MULTISPECIES: hypothetical protein [Acidianus]|uniref:Uncharacterized protein n=1 Tax=Candidatus Acidianus copahuensis TaxID=1160895 RepID=A0A031LLI2_9CREN|nr:MULTISPECIES: hypothetical protein [Acidianus]EZQ01758.1 hypothetical protein CM19_12390 [Candidatus Acidianus copahuensis]NON61339.1 hypothetical protein [Acidianus sp. RZ1]
MISITKNETIEKVKDELIKDLTKVKKGEIYFYSRRIISYKFNNEELSLVFRGDNFSIVDIFYSGNDSQILGLLNKWKKDQKTKSYTNYINNVKSMIKVLLNFL